MALFIFVCKGCEIMASAGQLTARIVLGGIDAVERQLRNFSSSMNDIARQAREMGDSLRESGERFNEIGENIAPLSAGLVAIGGAAITASDNMAQATNNFSTKLGATGKELEGFQSVLSEVGKTGAGNLDEVSNAIIDVSKNMKGLSKGDMSGVTEQAMQLAKVMDSDVSEVSKTAGIMMKQFGISGQEAMDLMAKGYQNNMDFAGDYQDTLSEYSVYFSQMGFDAKDMFNTLVSGAEAGAFNLDKVGDAVKEFGIRSKDGSKTSKEAFKALGMDADKMTETFAKGGEGAKKAYAEVVNSLKDVSNEAERNAIGVALFGTQYEDMEADVIASTASMTDHMGDVSGAGKTMAENNKTFAQEMQGAWNEIQEAIAPVGDIMRDFISDVLPPLISGVKKVASAFLGLSPTTQKVVLAIGAIIAILPVLLVGIGSIMSVTSVAVSGFGALAKGFGLLGKAGTGLITVFKLVGKSFLTMGRFLMANPWVAIAVAIVALAILIYKNWDAIVAKTKEIWSGVVAWFAPLWAGFLGFIDGFVQGAIALWEGFKTGFMNVLTAVGNFFVAVWNGLKTVFMTILNFYIAYYTFIFNAFVTVAQFVWNVIKTVFLIAIGILVTLLSPLWNAFVTIWNAMVDIVIVVLDAIKGWLNTAITFLVGLWKKFQSMVKGVWNAILTNVIIPVVNRIKAVVQTIVGKIQAIMTAIKTAFKIAWNWIMTNVITPVITRIKSIINTVVAFVQSVMNKVKQIWVAIFNAIKSFVQGVIDRIRDIIQKIQDKVKSVSDSVKSTFSSAFDWVKSKVTGAIDKIIDKVQGIWNKAKDVANNIKSAFSNLFGGIKVPSFSMGGWTMKDLPKLPKMKINWNANGGILDSATFIGAGEKGTESIVPLSSQRRMKPFATAVARFMPDGGKAGGDTTIHVAQLVVREEADIEKVAKRLNQLQDRKDRASGKLSFNN